MAPRIRNRQEVALPHLLDYLDVLSVVKRVINRPLPKDPRQFIMEIKLGAHWLVIWKIGLGLMSTVMAVADRPLALGVGPHLELMHLLEAQPYPDH